MKRPGFPAFFVKRQVLFVEEFVLEKLQGAEMFLIGIGEEFEERAFLKTQPAYEKAAAYLEQIDRPDLLPLLADGIIKEKGRAVAALRKLCKAMENKNYFLISTCQTDLLDYAGFPGSRVVKPCGTLRKKQCLCGCEQSLAETDETERTELYRAVLSGNGSLDVLGDCPHCHGRMVINNIYLEKYLESGYQEDWSRYTKWLQGTLNRKLCILELGVNLDYPSVIRFPFEKTGYYNRKAFFIRVNERLYHLTEELHERGVSMAKNAIDWLLMEDIL